MGKKQIGILEEVYHRLKKFRDEKRLASFTQAIITLLNFYEEKEAEVSAFIETQLGRMNHKVKLLEDKRMAELEKRMDEVAKGVIEKYIKNFEKVSTQKELRP